MIPLADLYHAVLAPTKTRIIGPKDNTPVLAIQILINRKISAQFNLVVGVPSAAERASHSQLSSLLYLMAWGEVWNMLWDILYWAGPFRN